MRFTAIIMTIFILLIAGALLVPSFINWNNYKATIIEQVETATGFDAEISGDISLAVLPMPHAILNGLSLKHPAEDVQMLQLESADVYVDIMPLLSGNVALKSITLNAPKIALHKFKDGNVNWMTDVLKGDGTSKETSSTSSVSIDSLSIKNGQLSYTDDTTGSVQDLKDVNALFSMASLEGPFDLDADLNAMGFPLNVKVTSEVMNAENKTLPLNLEVSLADNSAVATFSGILGMGAQMDVQGDTKVAVAKLRDFVKAASGQDNPNIPNTSFNSSGMLSASAKNIDYKNLTIKLGDMNMNGALQVTGLDQAPIAITTNLGSGDDKIKGGVRIDGRIINFDNLLLATAKSQVTLNGSWTAPETTTGRGTLNLKLVSPALNIDALSEKFGVKAAGGGETVAVKDMGKSLILPFDMTLTAQIDKLTVQDSHYNSLVFNGALKQNQLTITEASLKDYLDVNGTLRGSIANLETLTGLDLDVGVKASDVSRTINQFNVDKTKKIELPLNIGALDATAHLTGGLDQMQFDVRANTMKAVIAAKGTATDPVGKMSLSDLSLGIKHPDLNAFLMSIDDKTISNSALAKPVDVSARIDMTENIYTLNDIKGSFGPVQIGGNIVAETGGSVPFIKGSLNLGNVPLESFLPETEGNSKSTQSAVRWSRDTIDTAFLHSVQSDLAISAGKVTYGAWNFEQPSFKFAMKNGTLTVDQFKSGLFGGTAKVDIIVAAKPGKNQPLSIQTTANLDKVGLQSLVTALAGSAVVQSKGAVDFDTSLNTSGSNMAAIISSLAGKGTVNGNDITIQGIDIADLSRSLTDGGSLGNQAKALFKSGIQGGATTFETMAGAFTINGGIVNFDPLTVTSTEAVMTTTGNVSLPAWTIDMKSVVQLTEPADAPPLEMAFRGSLDNPGQSIAQNAIESYLNQKLSNKVNKLLEKKLGDKMDGELGGVIGGLLGVQKPQTQTAPSVTPNAPPPDVPPPGAEPAAGAEQPAANQNQQQSDKVDVEDVAKDLLKGLF